MSRYIIFKFGLMRIYLGRCPMCGGPCKETDVRVLKYLLPLLYCPRCDINYSAL